MWLVLAASLVAIGAAFAVSVGTRGALQANVDAARREPQLPAGNFSAALPPLPTAIFGIGRSDVLPQRYAYRPGAGDRFSPFERTIGTRIIGGLFPERPVDNPAGRVLGRFDLAFVAVFVYPIFLIALSYDIASADRDSGTLALVLAQPVSFRRWLFARAMSRIALLAIPLLLFPPALVTAASRSSIPITAAAHIFVWVVAVAAYCALWVALAAFLNTRRTTARLNALLLAAAWLLIVIVVPAGVSLAGRSLVPPASPLEFVVAERAASLAINPRIDEAGVAARREMSAAEAQRLATVLATHRRQQFESALAPILARLDELERRQATLMARLRAASPALLLQAVLDEAAGTGTERWADFLTQLDDYIRRREASVVAIEPFAYREEGSREFLERTALPLAALVAMALAMVVVSVKAAS